MTSAAHRSDPYWCCSASDAVAASKRAQWPWQVLHTLAHSRQPFSVSQLARLARLTPDKAAALAHDGDQLKWVRYAGQETEGDTKVYVGCLGTRGGKR